jgi:hypothetical protein
MFPVGELEDSVSRRPLQEVARHPCRVHGLAIVLRKKMITGRCSHFEQAQKYLDLEIAKFSR